MKYLIDANGNYYEADKNITGATEVQRRPSQNHAWQNGAWVYVEPPIGPIKAEKLAKIKADRNAAITGGFTYLNKPIDSDRDSVMAITGAAVAALAAKAAGLPYSVTWTCADDSTLTLDADGVLGMSITLAQFADAQHTKGRPLKDAIKNATAVDAVEAVAWG